MELQEILDKFEGVVEDHDGHLMQCPAHDDSQASLKIIIHENGKAGLVCRAGCANNDVVKASGLPWSAFFNITGAANIAPSAAPSPVTGPPVTRLAVYIDRCGERYEGSPAQQYAEERFGVTPDLAASLELGYDDGEGFAHTHAAYNSFPRLVVPFPDHTGRPHALQGRDLTGECEGRWVGLTNPKEMAWGRYAFWRTAEGADGPVIVSEGPGDGLSAVAAGFDALAIRGAALASAEGLVEALQGRVVVAAGDNDTAGQKFNDTVRGILEPHGIEVRALPIPEALGNKADLTDWRAVDPEGFPNELKDAAVEAMTRTKREVKTVSTEVAEKLSNDGLTKDAALDAAKTIADMLSAYGGGDATNAYALVQWTGNRIRFAKGLGFFVWTGRIWEAGETRVRQEIHRMGAALVLAGRVDVAKAFTTSRFIDDMIKELKAVPSVYVDESQFDSDPDILSFRNGVVELRTGTLREHRKEDMVTSSLEVDYNPSAVCRRWEQFLAEVMPGMPDMPEYLQRLIGYGITGSSQEHCFAVLFGKGANGKSVFVDTLSDVFKGITKDTPTETFEEKAKGAISNDVAALRDARLVTASEGNANRAMSEGMIKKATGSKNFTARFMRAEFFTFTPKFLVLMDTNHKPQFQGQDDGLWRRVKLIPWKRFFRPEERDKYLGRKLLAESEGIAAWAVRGSMQWYRDGLNDPEVIQSATADYRETSNPLHEFCPGLYEITKSDTDHVSGATVYLDYKDWCEANGLQRGDVWKRPTLYRALEDLGASKEKDRSGIRLYGIRKVEADVAPDGPGIFGTD